MFPKKAGRLEPELNPEQLQRLGRFLARIHLVGEGFPKVSRPKLDTNTYGREALAFVMQSNLIPVNLQSRYEQIVSQICTDVEKISAQWEYILLHGDCHNGNLLWNGNEPFIIDFDDMIYAPPVQDIWMLTGGDDEYGKKQKDILLSAYEEIKSFDEESLKWVEPLRSLRIIHFNAWIAKRWEDASFQRAFPLFPTDRYWQEQIETLWVQAEKVVLK